MFKIIITRGINTCRSTCCCAISFILALHLAGCEPEGDLEPGQTVIHLVRTRTWPDGDVTKTDHAFYCSSATVENYPHFTPANEDAWALTIPLLGVPDYYVSVVFKSPGPNPLQLAKGDGKGYVVSVDVPEKEHGGDSPFDGVMHITGLSGATASGNVSVGVDVGIRFYGSEGPPGEILRVESAAFHRIPIEGAPPDSSDGPCGFNDNEDLGQCTLVFTNETGYLLTHGMFEPTDSFGILKELPNLPIEHGDTRTMQLTVGVYQMKVNHQLFKQPPYYYFTSFNHACIKDRILEVTATLEDLKVGMFKVINKSGFSVTVTGVFLASTDDLIFGDNVLDGVLADGDEALISTGPGRFYWLVEDSEGNTYFSSTHVYGSVDGEAYVHPVYKQGRELCTLTLTNSTGVTLEYVYIEVMGQEYDPWEPYYVNDEVFDSRGNLPSSEALDILIAPGTWTLRADNIHGSGDGFEISGLVCSDGLPMTATLTPEDIY